jgi:hypothetical protein
VKKARKKLEKEEGLARNATPDFMTPANAFETHVGSFWGIEFARGYMIARFMLARDHLLRMGTRDGVQEALEHMRDMLRLSRRDHFCLQRMIPTLMLRLDLDQECYDFVKWWATTDSDGSYDWRDMTLPYLDIRGADVLEDPAYLVLDLDALIAVLLLKLKLLVDIRNLKITRKITALRNVPFDIAILIESAVIRSPLSIQLQRQSFQSLSHIESKLLYQAHKLGGKLMKTNINFTSCLFDPDEALSKRPGDGPWEEMALAMRHSYSTWWETEGVLDLLKDARACAAKDVEDQIEDWKTFLARRGEFLTTQQVLKRVAPLRTWFYLVLAVRNASYLGPSSERPSERYRRGTLESDTKAIAEQAKSDFEFDDGAVL